MNLPKCSYWWFRLYFLLWGFSFLSHATANQNAGTSRYVTFLTWIFLHANFQLIQPRFIGRQETMSVQKINFQWHSAFNELRNKRNTLKCSSCVFRCIHFNSKPPLQLQLNFQERRSSWFLNSVATLLFPLSNPGLAGPRRFLFYVLFLSNSLKIFYTRQSFILTAGKTFCAD